MPGSAKGSERHSWQVEEDKVAIVVGAGSIGPGYGSEQVHHLRREGARVFCVDRKRAAAEETVGLIAKEGGEAVAFEAEPRSDSVKAMVDACMAR